MSHFLRPLLARHPVAQALVNERTGSVVAETLETAFDSGTRRRGLLGRDDLPAGSALVLAPCNAVHTVRMRFPIDVVFVATGRAGHEDRASGWPRGAPPRRSPRSPPSSFAPGRSRAARLIVGDRLVVRSL